MSVTDFENGAHTAAPVASSLGPAAPTSGLLQRLCDVLAFRRHGDASMAGPWPPATVRLASVASLLAAGDGNVAPQPSLPSPLPSLPPRVALGCAPVDALLCGGFLRGAVTEVAGEAGVGKTQLALQALLQGLALLPGLGQSGGSVAGVGSGDAGGGVSVPSRPLGGAGSGCVVLLCSEDVPMRRLRQMAAARFGAGPRGADEALERLFIRRVASLGDLDAALAHCAAALPKPMPVIVVDSIAAAAASREGDDSNDGVDGGGNGRGSAVSAAALLHIGARLARTAAVTGAAVVVTNQVRAACAGDANGSGWANAFAPAVPALGLPWACCPETRLLASFAAGGGAASSAPPAMMETTGAARPRRRDLRVVFSAHLPPRMTSFTVAAEGIVAPD